jgi:hypothetical protein
MKEALRIVGGARFARGIATAVMVFSAQTLLANISYTGVFIQDDQMFSAGFSLATPSNIVIQTWSFAGGADAAGQMIPAGGFATVVSLFDSSGNLLTFDDGGVAPSACAPRQIDPDTQFCLDAYIQENQLPPGQYTVVLTEFDNTPNGPTLSDGFVEQGNGDFTAVPGVASGPFFLNDGPGFQRTGNWELDVPGAVPEPSGAVLLGTLLCIFALRKNRKIRPLFRKLFLLMLPAAAGAVTFPVAGDAYLSQTYANQNFGNSPTLNVGGNLGAGNWALLRFDLSSLPKTITANDIQKATLTVFVNKVFASGALDVTGMTFDWQEPVVTYSQVFNLLATLSVVNTVPVTTSDSYVTFDITSLVNGWVNSPSTNNGVLITASATAPNTVVALDSKEATSTSHAAYLDVTLAPQMAAQNCVAGSYITGFDSNGKPICTAAQTPLERKACALGSYISGFDSNGNPICSAPLADGGCVAGTYVAGFTSNGGFICKAAQAPLAGTSCGSMQFLAGFNSDGSAICRCLPRSFADTVTSITASFPLFGLPTQLEYWPGNTDVLGSGDCSVTVDGPGYSSIDDTTSSTGNTGWKVDFFGSGFSSCTIANVQLPNCGSLAAIPRLDINSGRIYPACSSAAVGAGSTHSTDTAIIACNP